MGDFSDLNDRELNVREIEGLFYPNPIDPSFAPPGGAQLLAIPLGDGHVASVTMFVCNERNVMMVVFPGNGEIADSYEYLAPLYSDNGVNVVVVDYRGYGRSTGTPYYDVILEDAVTVYHGILSWIRTRNMKESIFVMGYSLGAGPAAEILGRDLECLSGVIFTSGFGGLPWKIQEIAEQTGQAGVVDAAIASWSNGPKVARGKRPVLILHGSDDDQIAPSEADLLERQVPVGVHVEKHIIQGAGHNDIQLHDEYHGRIRAFVERFG